MKSIVVDSVAELQARPERKDIGPHKPADNGFGLCPWCGRRVHRVTRTYAPANGWVSTEVYVRHNPIARTRPIHDNDRTHCSSCGRPFPAYELKPGDGRCKECQP